MDPSKIESIKEWPTPKNVKNIQQFLGLANYYRRFIQGYSQIALPLTQLTRKDVKWIWQKEQQEAFEQLKERFITRPVLSIYNPQKELRVETDASNAALGACLLQLEDKDWHPVAYHSRKFNKAEERYSTPDQELMAIVDSCEHWRAYLHGKQFTVYSDHQNLTYFLTSKKLNGRQARWYEKLSEYDFTIKYTKGKENIRADALSRRPDYQASHEEGALFTEQNGNLILTKQIQLVHIENELLQKIRTEQGKDPLLIQELSPA
jgi:hypothetical protein